MTTPTQSILNLDEILAEQPQRTVIWNGENHPVTGMTGEAYLQFLRARKGLDKAQKDGDEVAQWEQNLLIIGIVVPTLAGPDNRKALLTLRLPVLTKLTEYIMNEFASTDGESQIERAAAEPTGGADEQPGEST